MGEIWASLDEWLIIQAHRVTKSILKHAERYSRIKMNVFREVLAFYVYCAINAFRAQGGLTDEQIEDIHSDVYRAFGRINRRNVPYRLGDSLHMDFLEKKRQEIIAITQERDFNQLVYAYLLGDRTISQTDDDSFAAIAGMVGVEDLSNYIIANNIVSLCRILNVLGIIKAGKYEPGFSLRIVGVWLEHDSSTTSVINHLGTVVQKAYRQ